MKSDNNMNYDNKNSNTYNNAMATTTHAVNCRVYTTARPTLFADTDDAP